MAMRTCENDPGLKSFWSSRIFLKTWIRNPFVDNAIAPQGFTSLEAEQFIDLSSDLTLKSIYNTDSITSFWITARFEFSLT